MKLVSFQHGGRDRFGAVVGDGVVDFSGTMFMETLYPDLVGVFAAGAVGELRKAVEGAKPTLGFSDITLNLPIPHPGKILCVGRNYRAYHEVQEMGKAPQWPSIFGRFVDSFVPHDAPLVKPTESDQLDYEGHLAVVIWRAGRLRVKIKVATFQSPGTSRGKAEELSRPWRSQLRHIIPPEVILFRFFNGVVFSLEVVHRKTTGNTLHAVRLRLLGGMELSRLLPGLYPRDVLCLRQWEKVSQFCAIDKERRFERYLAAVGQITHRNRPDRIALRIGRNGLMTKQDGYLATADKRRQHFMQDRQRRRMPGSSGAQRVLLR